MNKLNIKKLTEIKKELEKWKKIQPDITLKNGTYNPQYIPILQKINRLIAEYNKNSDSDKLEPVKISCTPIQLNGITNMIDTRINKEAA